MAEEAIGSVLPKSTMLFRVAAGEATSPDGRGYEMTTAIGTGCPIVRSKQTGKWFLLSWEELIALAIAAGIDE